MKIPARKRFIPETRNDNNHQHKLFYCNIPAFILLNNNNVAKKHAKEDNMLKFNSIFSPWLSRNQCFCKEFRNCNISLVAEKFVGFLQSVASSGRLCWKDVFIVTL